MLPYFKKSFGNPSSLHSFGIDASNAVEDSRRKIADLIGAKNDEIIFTSGGTESDNLAIKGIAFKNKDKRKKDSNNIITSVIEHPAVLETCKFLEKEGFVIKYLPVDKHGLVDLNELEQSISDNTFLLTIMFANNEIGTIEPIKEIGKISKKHDIIFHTDAVQALCKTNIDVKELGLDMLSLSSHKINGPKGVGALYVKNNIDIDPLIHGGGHEKNIRSGTLNTPGIVGLGKACELGGERLNIDIPYLKKLRDKLIDEILNIENSYLNGHPSKRLVNNASFHFSNIEGESLLMMLDEYGVASSTGSACSSKKLYSSHVLKAIGLKEKEAQASIRLSLDRNNTMEEILYVSNLMPEIVKKLRDLSPI